VNGSAQLLETPVIIEAAISPLRWDIPHQSVEEIVTEAEACIAAGAGIVHHHHDMRMSEEEAIAAFMACATRIHAAHPTALTYTDYLAGKKAWEENAHLKPMAEAGELTMFAIDPGITTFPSRDRDGRPIRTYTDGLRFDECHELIEFSKHVNVPISLGVFEPGHLRWILAYEESDGFSPGTIVKLYFGGGWMVDRVDVPGIGFGLPPTPQALDIYLSMMNGSSLPWIVSAFGDSLLDLPLARHAMERGGHIRVGIEDAAGRSQRSNAEMVAAAVALANDVGRPVATAQNALTVLRSATSVIR
jgi:3-keto-5-aminohexanoate cleavage enzyme